LDGQIRDTTRNIGEGQRGIGTDGKKVNGRRTNQVKDYIGNN